MIEQGMAPPRAWVSLFEAELNRRLVELSGRQFLIAVLKRHGARRPSAAEGAWSADTARLPDPAPF
jgi:hypothetical protein